MTDQLIPASALLGEVYEHALSIREALSVHGWQDPLVEQLIKMIESSQHRSAYEWRHAWLPLGRTLAQKYTDRKVQPASVRARASVDAPVQQLTEAELWELVGDVAEIKDVLDEQGEHDPVVEAAWAAIELGDSELLQTVWTRATEADWDPHEHPRDNHGKFAKKPGGGGAVSSVLNKFGVDLGSIKPGDKIVDKKGKTHTVEKTQGTKYFKTVDGSPAWVGGQTIKTHHPAGGSSHGSVPSSAPKPKKKPAKPVKIKPTTPTSSAVNKHGVDVAKVKAGDLVNVEDEPGFFEVTSVDPSGKFIKVEDPEEGGDMLVAAPGITAHKTAAEMGADIFGPGPADTPTVSLPSNRFEPVDVTGWKKVGGQLGSNQGGVYEAPNGDRYYMKVGKSKDHVRNELVANELYKAAGIKVMDLHAARTEDGKLATISPWESNAEINLKHQLNGGNQAYVNEVQDGFATDAWLGNWDVAGLTFDNIADVQGVPVRVDPGGALLFRAQGVKKGAAFGDKVNEWDTLRDPGKNPQAAKLFGSMTPEQRIESAKHVAQVSKAQIDDIVNRSGFDPKTAQELKKKLLDRQGDLLQRAALENQKLKQGKATVSTPPTDLSQLTPADTHGLDDWEKALLDPGGTSVTLYKMGDKVDTPYGKGTVQQHIGNDVSVKFDAGGQTWFDKSSVKPVGDQNSTYQPGDKVMVYGEPGTVSSVGELGSTIQTDSGKTYVLPESKLKDVVAPAMTPTSTAPAHQYQVGDFVELPDGQAGKIAKMNGDHEAQVEYLNGDIKWHGTDNLMPFGLSSTEKAAFKAGKPAAPTAPATPTTPPVPAAPSVPAVTNKHGVDLAQIKVGDTIYDNKGNPHKVASVQGKKNLVFKTEDGSPAWVSANGVKGHQPESSTGKKVGKASALHTDLEYDTADSGNVMTKDGEYVGNVYQLSHGGEWHYTSVNGETSNPEDVDMGGTLVGDPMGYSSKTQAANAMYEVHQGNAADTGIPGLTQMDKSELDIYGIELHDPDNPGDPDKLDVLQNGVKIGAIVPHKAKGDGSYFMYDVNGQLIMDPTNDALPLKGTNITDAAVNVKEFNQFKGDSTGKKLPSGFTVGQKVKSGDTQYTVMGEEDGQLQVKNDVTGATYSTPPGFVVAINSSSSMAAGTTGKTSSGTGTAAPKIEISELHDPLNPGLMQVTDHGVPIGKISASGGKYFALGSDGNPLLDSYGAPVTYSNQVAAAEYIAKHQTKNASSPGSTSTGVGGSGTTMSTSSPSGALHTSHGTVNVFSGYAGVADASTVALHHKASGEHVGLVGKGKNASGVEQFYAQDAAGNVQYFGHQQLAIDYLTKEHNKKANSVAIGANGEVHHTGWGAMHQVPNAKDHTTLGAPEQKALHKYTHTGYMAMNSSLRDPAKHPPSYSTKKSIADLDKLFDSVPATTEPIQVWRGTYESSNPKLFGPIGSKVGKTFHDPAYLSTAANSQKSFGGDAKIKIDIPPGAKVVRPNGYGKYGDGEMEILLARGGRFEVLSDEMVNGKRQIHLRMIV